MKYYNLTQTEGKRMCYFRSTDIEQKNWKRLLYSFPDEMLYFMSQGKKIVIIDKSKREKGKIERIFIPVMNDLLNYIYFKTNPKNWALIAHFDIAYSELVKDTSLYTKFKFWKKFINKVELVGVTIQRK